MEHFLETLSVYWFDGLCSLSSPGVSRPWLLTSKLITHLTWPTDLCGIWLGTAASCPPLTCNHDKSVLGLHPPRVPCPTLGAPASGLPGSSGPLCSSHFRSMEKACMFSHWSSVKCWPVERTVKKSEATAPSTSVMGPGWEEGRGWDEPARLLHYQAEIPCPLPRLHCKTHLHPRTRQAYPNTALSSARTCVWHPCQH